MSADCSRAEARRRGGWEVRKIKYTFTERNQKGFPELPLLAATQSHGVILKSKYENRTVEATKALDTLKLVEVGDFVISLRSFQGGLEMAHDRGIISPAYTVLTPTHISREYFKHFAKAPTFISLLKSTVTGIREGQNIDYNRLRECYLEIPPLAEQLAIGAYLDAKLEGIDKAIASEEKMIALLQERREIIINEAVGCQIGKNLMKLKFLCRISSGEAWSKEMLSENENDYPVYGGGNCIGYTKQWNCDESMILVGRVGSCGTITFPKRKYWATDNALILKASGVNLDYFYFALCAANLKTLNVANAQPLITATKVKNVSIPLPPLPEQEAIVAHLDQETAKIDRAIETKRRQIALLRERRAIIIDEAVTGRADTRPCKTQATAKAGARSCKNQRGA